MSGFFYGKQRPSILAVDDDEMNLMTVEMIFGEETDIKCVSSGREALDWLDKNECDLVLLDLRMPEMDGFEVLQCIKENERTADIPVIILTGDIEAELEAEGFVKGATDFVRKPFIPDAVRQRVRRVLEYEYLKDNLENAVRIQTALAEERLAENQEILREMLLALVKTIDAKDEYTHGHSERVAEYSRMIAERAGETPEAQEYIYYMALLHDIGKIGIDREILNKPGALTDKEYETMQSHTLIGATILEDIEKLPGISIGAHYHHERYDGKGYPEGISGNDIPKQARIIAVADSYDTMSSRRSYRDVLPQEVIRNEIAKCRGQQFDPQYADIMLQLIDEDKDYNMREKKQVK